MKMEEKNRHKGVVATFPVSKYIERSVSYERAIEYQRHAHDSL